MTLTLPLKIRQEIEKYSAERKLSGEEKQQVMEIVEALYRKVQYDADEPIGVVTAQSLSEPATQMTMRTYHFAGTAGIQVTLGLPRLLEIFDARKPTTPTMTVRIQKDCQTMDHARRIAEAIKEVNVRDIVTSTVLDLSEFHIICTANKDKLKSLGMDAKALEKALKVRNAAVTVEEGRIIVKPKKGDITNLHKLKYAVLETHIKGIKDITQVVVTKEGEEWVINTLGSNMKKVFEIEGVDQTRTISNNMFEVYGLLGIEAARNVLIDQAEYTIKEQGLGIDIRYIMLLADLMTVAGDIRTIGRYGISGQKSSFLVRASFEETKKHLTTAAIHGEADPMQGAIENIMLNQVAPIGTGGFSLYGKIPVIPKDILKEYRQQQKEMEKAAKKAEEAAAKRKEEAIEAVQAAAAAAAGEGATAAPAEEAAAKKPARKKAAAKKK